MAVISALLLAALGVASARDCLPRSDSVDLSTTYSLVPIEVAADCFESVGFVGRVATQEVDSVDAILDAGYAYYNYNWDVLASDPISPPPNGADWEIHTGPGGGEVDYREAFGGLKDAIKENGQGTLMLAYEIQDIQLRARDRHTAPNRTPAPLAMYVPHGNTSGRLSLRQDQGGEIQVIVIHASGTRVVTSINGEDPIAFLEELTSNTGLGGPSQFKSKGVRLNNFLAAFTPGSPLEEVVWLVTDPGDFRKLPPTLEMEYEDGSVNEWAFGLLVLSELVGVPGDVLRKVFIDDVIAQSEVIAAYSVLSGDLDEIDKPAVAGKRARRMVGDGLSFTEFGDSAGSVYSAYAVYDRGSEGKVMIWKLPTLQGLSGTENYQLTFWNAMVEAADKEGIDTLLIDIADNGGGNIDYAYRNLFLLFQDAEPDDVVHQFRMRMTPPFTALWEAWDRSQEIWDALLDVEGNEQAVAALLRFMDDTITRGELVEVVDQFQAVDGLATAFVRSSGYRPNNPLFFYAEYLTLVRVRKYAETLARGGQDVTEEDIRNILSTLNSTLLPPKFCQNNLDSCEAVAREGLAFTETVNAGGVRELMTVPLYMGQFTSVENLQRSKPDVVNIADNAAASPFDRIILLSNSAGVGSAANMLESGMRYLSYIGQSRGLDGATWPSVTGVSMGCFDAADCEMTQFQGSIDDGATAVSRLYQAALPLDALRDLLHILPPEILEPLGLTADDVDEYSDLVDAFGDLLPPPSMSGLPSYASTAIYPLGNTDTIPQEFYNRPADVWLPIWPTPGGLSLGNPVDLQMVYDATLAAT